jgi:hypothetical protein
MIVLFTVFNIFYLSNLETYGTLNGGICGRGCLAQDADLFRFYSNRGPSTTLGYDSSYTLKDFTSSTALYEAVAKSIIAESLMVIVLLLFPIWLLTEILIATTPSDPNKTPWYLKKLG